MLIIKVRTFWETHKIWKNLPHGKSADLLSKCQNHEEDFFKLRELLKKSVGTFLNMLHLYHSLKSHTIRSITQNFQNGISNYFHFVLLWSFSLNSLFIYRSSTYCLFPHWVLLWNVFRKFPDFTIWLIIIALRKMIVE